MIRPIVERVGDEVKINLFPKQADFVNSEVDDILYGGAAGGGKSQALLIFGALRRMQHPTSNGLMLRRTFSQLEKSLILKSKQIYPLFGATYHEAKKLWAFPNGSLQHFGYLERDADTFNYHSDEYHDICFDESSLFTPFQLNYMTSRCRSTLPGCKALIRLASNPGNVSHMFLKEKYIEPSKTQKIWFDDVQKIHRSFISAKVDDNPAMMELDPGYKDRLRILGDQKYMALAEGNWDVFEGAYFNFDIRPGYGVLPYRRVPDTDTFKFLSLDWGYADPASIHWWELMPSGRLIAYRELYITRLSPKELAAKILEMCPTSERYEYIACPPEIWGKKVELDGGGESIQSLIESVLGERLPMIKAPNARIPGWLKMKEYMSPAGDGRPWMQISPVCENLIKNIVGAIHDDRPGGNVEDISPMCEDHAIDDARYAIMTLQNAPRNNNEIISPYERLFGIKEDNKNFSNLPMSGRGGY